MADQPAKRIKRRIKNSETFRERAIKAAEAGQAARPGRIKRAATGPLKTIFKPFVTAAGKLFGLTALKPVRQLLSPVGNIIFPTYLRRSWQELRLVTWPSWRESRRLTFAVLVFAVVFGAAIAGVDWGLDKVFKNILLK